MEKDKIAILITAHSDFKQLAKLCYALDYPKFDIYIHINKLIKMSDEIKNIKLKYSSVYVLKKRIKVHWGGYSLLKAILGMYKIASEKNIYFRYINLSGLDYPIKNNDEIYKELTKDKTEFIIACPFFKYNYNKINIKYSFDDNILQRLIKKIKFKLCKKRK